MDAVNAADDVALDDYKIDNIDMIYKRNEDYTVDYFLIVMNIKKPSTDDYYMYFFQLNRIDFTVVFQTYLRREDIVGSKTYGKLAFGIPYPGYLDSEFFYYIKNVPKFTNTDTTNEVLVSRKAFLFSNDNKYDCEASSFVDPAEVTLAITLVNYGSDCDIDVKSII